MKVGHEHHHKEYRRRNPDEQLEKAFKEIEILGLPIGGKIYDVDVGQMVSIKTIGNEYTAEEVDRTLEAVASYKFTLLTAYEEAKKKREIGELDNKEWLALTEIGIEEKLVERNIEETKEPDKTRTMSNVHPTSGQITNALWTHEKYGKQYKERQLQEKELKRQEDKLKRLYDILEARGFELGKILDRRARLEPAPPPLRS